MNFEDPSIYDNVDPDSYYSTLVDLPRLMAEFWQAFKNFPEIKLNKVETIIFSGQQDFLDVVGLFSEYVNITCNLNIRTRSIDQLHDSFNPAATLIILFEPHPNNEIREIMASSIDQNYQIIFISEEANGLFIQSPQINYFWIPENIREEFTGLAFSTAIFFSVLQKVGLIRGASSLIESLQAETQILVEKLGKGTITSQNPSKRLAGQLMDRLVVFACSEKMEGVARFWRSHFRNIAKTCVFHEVVTSTNSSLWNGVIFPEGVLSRTLFVFLKSNLLAEEAAERVDQFHNHLLTCGIGTDVVAAQGDNFLLHIWNLTVFGYFTGYYLAIANEVNPVENFLPQDLS